MPSKRSSLFCVVAWAPHLVAAPALEKASVAPSTRGASTDALVTKAVFWVNDGGAREAHTKSFGVTASCRAMDYLRYGELEGVSCPGNVATYVESNGGVARNQTPKSGYGRTWATSAWLKASTLAKKNADVWLTTSVDDESDFPGTLRAV